MANRNLTKAKEAKKDEFYTQLEDINNELRHYREHFRGKTVLCARSTKSKNVKHTNGKMVFVYIVANISNLKKWRQII